MLLSAKSSKISVEVGIMVVDGGRRLTIAAVCRGSLDDELPMPASNHSLRLTAIVRRARYNIARLTLIVLPLCAAGWSIAQAQAPQPRADQEPITPIPSPPARDPRQVALGDRLFHDPRLSHDDTRSCNSCHDTSTNGATAINGASASPNSTPDAVELNVPTVFNAALNFRLNWEGDLRTLEGQVEQTLDKSHAMGWSVDEALHKLRADPDVARQFREAFGREPDSVGLLDAIAAYERTLLTPGSRFDRWLKGDVNAITAEEFVGYQLFKSLGCVSCHQGVNVGGNMYQRHGIFHPLASPKPEIVRVPSLRNVAVTPPYFHDGSAATLSRAVQEMGYAQLDRKLTDDQTKAIVAFLNTLTGTYLGKPVSPAGQSRQSDAPK
jgi:cytochrome c peroxidase